MWTALVPLALALLQAREPLAPPVGAPAPPAGVERWDLALASPGGALGFGLELAADGRAWLVNGEERIPVGPLERAGERFVLPLPPYRSRLVGTWRDGAPVAGEWQRDKGAGWVTELELLPQDRHTRRPAAPARRVDPERDPARFTGRWSVDFGASDERAVGVFEVAAAPGTGPRASAARGTFLTTVGDYRFLAGRAVGDRLELSCFDGAHAFLFRAWFEEDGTLAGDFWSRGSWHESWTAVRDPDAALPDGFGLSRWTGSVPLGELAYPDLALATRRLDDPAFAGRARLLVVFGSWCPNCNDLTDLLVRLQARYGEEGLSILGLAFEFADEPAARAAAVRAYMEHHGARWPVLIAGPTDKEAASAAFPLLDRVRAYPTTVFMDGSGDVKAVYTGFNGPATGALHEELVRRFEALVEELLAPADDAGIGGGGGR